MENYGGNGVKQAVARSGTFSRQLVAAYIEKIDRRMKAVVIEKSGRSQGVGPVVTRTGKNDCRLRRAPARRYLVSHPFGHALDDFAGGDPLGLDGVALDGPYLLVGK